MTWQWFINFKIIINALLRLESTMGAVADALAGVKDQLAKAKGEILAKLADLEAQLADAGKLDPADVAAIQDLKDAAQGLDDVVPDASTEPTA